MRDIFEVIRDVRIKDAAFASAEGSARGEQIVGIEVAADIVAALNKEGYVIVRYPAKDPGRAPR